MNPNRDHDPSNLKHKDITGVVLKCFFRVHTELGFGFLESVYHQAMLLELADHGLKVQSEVPLRVLFKNKPIGVFYPDIIVDDVVIIELKSVSGLTSSHKAQLLNYLKASQCEVGMLLNFGRNAEFQRLVFENHPSQEISLGERVKLSIKKDGR